MVVAPMGGALWLGLEYASIPSLPIMRNASPEQYDEIFAGLRLMEAAARTVMNERKSEE